MVELPEHGIRISAAVDGVGAGGMTDEIAVGTLGEAVREMDVHPKRARCRGCEVHARSRFRELLLHDESAEAGDWHAIRATCRSERKGANAWSFSSTRGEHQGDRGPA